jgi:hypothetical protein
MCPSGLLLLATQHACGADAMAVPVHSERHAQTAVCGMGLVRTVGLRIALSEPSFKIAPKGNGIPHASLAYEFEHIIK